MSGRPSHEELLLILKLPNDLTKRIEIDQDPDIVMEIPCRSDSVSPRHFR
jgi:hypothetical protein